MSNIPGFASFQTVYYELEQPTTFSVATIEPEYDQFFGLYTSSLLQDSKQVEEKWSVLTFNKVLAYIGGYVGLVWGVISVLVGGY